MVIHRLFPTIDVYIREVGECKALFIIDYHDQTNSMWKCRIYETGRVINAYDDDVIVHANYADGEKPVKVPAEWKKTK